MNELFKLWPDIASQVAWDVDTLTIVMTAVSVFFTVGVLIAMVFFVLRYWHTRRVNRELHESTLMHWSIEMTWMIIPLIINIVFFFWGGALFVQAQRPPDDAISIHVVGKQWMWKIAHENGRREINTLHVPVGKPVRLTMTSEDVIHSFYIPAFRKKQDVLPGRLVSLWFVATKPGTYHLFCAEFCGTSHARMAGQVIVQSQEQYAQWLAEGYNESLAQRGRNRVASLGCLQCHGVIKGKRVGPPLNGLLGRKIPLDDGTTVVADQEYIRRSMFEPQAQVHAGYKSTMPTYRGRVGPEEMLEILAYVRSVQDAAGPLAGPGTSGSSQVAPRGGDGAASKPNTESATTENADSEQGGRTANTENKQSTPQPANNPE